MRRLFGWVFMRSAELDALVLDAKAGSAENYALGYLRGLELGRARGRDEGMELGRDWRRLYPSTLVPDTSHQLVWPTLVDPQPPDVPAVWR